MKIEGEHVMKGTSRSWKLERASVNEKGKARPRSNKYSASDSDQRPEPGTRERIWIGGYDRADGTHVDGYYRSAPGR
jgi:hypothetical protein